MHHKREQHRRSGFTIVELVIVIIVIALLAALTIFAFGTWRSRTAVTEIKNDLMNVASAMKLQRTFNNQYPTALPSGYNNGQGVTVTYITGDADTYCIEASSKVVTGIKMFISSDNQTPQFGTCGTGAGTYTPGSNVVVLPNYLKLLSANWTYTCGVSYTDDVYCWGQGYTGSSTTPKKIFSISDFGGNSIRSIAVGKNSILVLTANGSVYGWGSGGSGQLGPAASSMQYTPVQIPLGGKAATTITAGTDYACAITSDGAAYCWGYNTLGTLGNGTTTQSSTPVAVSTAGALSGKTFVSISAGDDHTCAIASDNLAYCWGNNGNGQLGTGVTGPISSTPVAVSTAGALSGKTIKSLSNGVGLTCAIASDNLAYCWGSNGSGQLGNGTTGFGYYGPAAVTSTGFLNGKTIKSIASGGGFACAIASDNLAYCWGANPDGRLGNGTTTDSNVPMPVTNSGALSGKTIKLLPALLRHHVCVLASDNQTYCWGINQWSNLGNGNTTSSSVPIATAALP